MSLTFFQRFCLFRFSKFYECNQHFLLGMEGSLHNCSFLIVFINRMKESFNQNRHFSTLLGRHYPRSSGFPNWKHSIQKFHDVHSTLLKIDFFSAFQENNSAADILLQPGLRNIELNDLEALFTQSDKVLTQDDLLSFLWQIACGMVTLQYF